MSNKSYNFWKWVALILLPALGAAYFALDGIWGLPYTTQIVGTLTVADTFLGALLHISTAQYQKDDSNYDGTMHVDNSDPDKDVYSMEVNGPVESLAEKDSVTFKVNKPDVAVKKTRVSKPRPKVAKVAPAPAVDSTDLNDTPFG